MYPTKTAFSRILLPSEISEGSSVVAARTNVYVERGKLSSIVPVVEESAVKSTFRGATLPKTELPQI